MEPVEGGVLMGALYRAGRWWWGKEMVGRAAAVENQFLPFQSHKGGGGESVGHRLDGGKRRGCGGDSDA
jgi:hypothetical protein